MGYSLAILGYDPKVASHFSVEAFTDRLWSSFAELKHVELETYDIRNVPAWRSSRAEVCLVHCYAEDFRAHGAELARQFMVTSSFMEIPYNVMIPFVFCRGAGISREILVSYPSLVDIDDSPSLSDKILLDHWWPGNKGPVTDELYRHLELLGETFEVYQFERHCPELIPSWVQRIETCPFDQYVQRTAGFRFFVMTHPGSYNGSVVDMAARRCWVLALRGVPLPDHITSGLVRVFDDLSSLVGFISSSPPAPPVPESITPFDVAVDIMDRAIRRAS